NFAGLEVDEQETAGDVLKSLSNLSNMSGKIAIPTEADVMAALTPDAKQTLQDLTEIKGRKFDLAYIAAEIDGHRKLLKIQEAYLGEGRFAPAIIAAKFIAFAINEHLNLLARIDARLKS